MKPVVYGVVGRARRWLLWSFCLIVTGMQAATSLHRDASVLRLDNGLVAVTFNVANGDWEAMYSDGTVFASDLQCGVITESVAGSRKGPQSFSFSRIKGVFGPGVRVVVDRMGERPFLLVITMHDDQPFFLVQMQIPEAKGLSICGATMIEGRFRIGEDPGQVSVLVNKGDLRTCSEIQHVDLQTNANRWSVGSQFMLAGYNRGDGRSLLLGALQSEGVNTMSATVNTSEDDRTFHIKASSRYVGDPLRIESGSWFSPVWMVAVPGRIVDGLEVYGRAFGALRATLPPATGCSGWWAVAPGVAGTSASFLTCLDVLKGQRLAEYGLRIAGWDARKESEDGFEKNVPDGYGDLSSAVRSRGFVVGKRLESGGDVPAVSPGFPISHLLSQRLEKMTAEEGVGVVIVEAGHGFTVAQPDTPLDVTWRRALGVLGQIGANHQARIMTRGGPEWWSFGVLDGMSWGTTSWNGTSTNWLADAMRWGRRFYGVRNMWGDGPAWLNLSAGSLEQSRARASFFALSGGSVWLGDDPRLVESSRWEILKHILPLQAASAHPCDLFDLPGGWQPKCPRIWQCSLTKPAVGAWQMVGAFNWGVHSEDAEDRNVTIDFARHLGLKTSRRYLAFDFWRQQYLGIVTNRLSVDVPPGECRILALREEEIQPQVLGDDRHVLTGYEAIRQIMWEPEFKRLRVTIQTVRKTSYALHVHVPSHLNLVRAVAHQKEADVERKSASWAVVTVDSGPTGQVACELQFETSAGPSEIVAAESGSALPPASYQMQNGEITLDQVRPRWSFLDQDGDGGCLMPNRDGSITATAPYRVGWDVSGLTSRFPRFCAEVRGTGDARVCYEVLGDGRSLYLSEGLGSGQKASVDISIQGIRELVLICHLSEGTSQKVAGEWIRPRLASPKSSP